MEVQNLRIGNWVYESLNNRLVTVHSIEDTWNSVRVSYANGAGCYLVNMPQIEPIPLTEEILLKAGCKYEESATILIIDRFRLKWMEAYKYWYVTTIDRSYITKVEFVHEWQNVLYALNDQELEINL